MAALSLKDGAFICSSSMAKEPVVDPSHDAAITKELADFTPGIVDLYRVHTRIQNSLVL
jgi:hypothetical protein